MINKKAKVNDINGIRIGDRWVDSVKDVKGEITSHFSLHFSLHFSDPLSERPISSTDPSLPRIKLVLSLYSPKQTSNRPSGIVNQMRVPAPMGSHLASSKNSGLS
ncbi:hypothetical protein ACS0TY_023780 [Phlomoides rotata]